jgi:predicted Zn-dependent peptidase
MVSPLKKMQEQFGSKEKLVASVKEALKPLVEKNAAELKNLKTQSTAKLMKLLESAKGIAEAGGREAVIEKIAAASRKANADVRAQISKLSVNELAARYNSIKAAAVSKIKGAKAENTDTATKTV